MSKNNPSIISIIVVAFFATLLMAILYFSHKVSIIPTNIKDETTTEIQFFITSFDSSPSQINSSLKTIFDLFDNNVVFYPHFIFEKVDDANQQLHPKSFLKTSNGSNYGSLHGRQEVNQNIREICALLQTTNKPQIWWQFVDHVRQNCSADNADICWEDQAKSAGLDASKISDCFNNDATAIIENEIATAKFFGVSSSPTIFINNVVFSNDRLNLSFNQIKTIICDSLGKKVKIQACQP